MKLFSRIIISCLFAALLGAVSVFAGDNDWRPVTAAELAMTKPQVDPEADAEAIFWEIRIDDKKRAKLLFEHYVRVKIFTERGQQKFNKFDIPFYKGRKVENVAARVIKPDGSVIEIKPSDIFDREIIRSGKIKINAKSFAVPGIEPGVIVEYRYSEEVKNDSVNGERLIFQREIPLQKVTYYIRPYKLWKLSIKSYNMPDIKFVEAQDNFYVASMTNVPAFKEEPNMPPEDELRKWVLLKYGSFSSFSWNLFANSASNTFAQLIKPNREIEQKTSEIVQGAATDVEKIDLIYQFVQKNIKNASFDPTISREQYEDMKVEDSRDVFRRGAGSPAMINLLFASMIKAAGFDANIVFSGDRNENFFEPQRYPLPLFVHPAAIAVYQNNSWSFHDPGSPFLANGELLWNEEGVYSLVVDAFRTFSWKKTPFSDFDKSIASRTGQFKLSEDGTLEGTVRIEYTGHLAIYRRGQDFQDSPATLANELKEEITERISTAEITDISIENLRDPTKPLTHIFKVRVPNYALKTGKRMFVQPGVFEYGAKPVFASAERIHPVYFRYGWSETDEIEIQLPAGYTLDGLENPDEISDPGKATALNISMEFEADSNTLKYRRNFYFGKHAKIYYQVDDYKNLKALFDLFNEVNTRVITLKDGI